MSDRSYYRIVSPPSRLLYDENHYFKSPSPTKIKKKNHRPLTTERNLKSMNSDISNAGNRSATRIRSNLAVLNSPLMESLRDTVYYQTVLNSSKSRMVKTPILSKNMTASTGSLEISNRKGEGLRSQDQFKVQEEQNPDSLTQTLEIMSRENEKLKVEVHRAQNELRAYKKNMKTNLQEGEDNQQIILDKDLKEILSTLELIIKKSQEGYNSIKKRGKRLNELINYLDSGQLSSFKGLEIRALSDSFKQGIEQLTSSADLEVQLAHRSRELVKKKLELANMNSRYQKLAIKCESLQSSYGALREGMKVEHQEKNIFVKNLTKEKTLNRETHKKLNDLQRTVELLTEGPLSKSFELADNDYANSQDNNNITTLRETTHRAIDDQLHGRNDGHEINTTKLREALSKLVKENDGLRRVIHNKGKEIEALNDNLSKATWKLTRATIRIEKLRNAKMGLKSSDVAQQEDKINMRFSRVQFLELTADKTERNSESIRGLPRNLDFRFANFDERHSDLINDVLERGSQAFAAHIQTLGSEDEIKQEVTLIANQFISYKHFAEKLNKFLAEVLVMLLKSQFSEIQSHVCNFKHIFKAETTRLWIIQPIVGTLKTYEINNTERKCSILKGVIGQVVKSEKHRDDDMITLEYISQDGTSLEERSKTCLFVPIRNEKGDVFGVLEVSGFNIDAFTVDLEYFGQILTDVISVLWRRMSIEKSMERDIKTKDMYFDAFSDIMKSTSQQEYNKKVEDWVQNIFKSSKAQYLTLVKDTFIKFMPNGSQKKLPTNSGVVGKVVDLMKPFILLDPSGDKIYCETIDIKTTLPLYTTPVLVKVQRMIDGVEYIENHVIGILQLVVNQKSFIKESGTEEVLVNRVKTLDPSFENFLMKFINIISLAYEVISSGFVSASTSKVDQKKSTNSPDVLKVKERLTSLY